MKKEKNIKNIALKYKIREIYLFGSRVSGEERPGSDFDIGVVFLKGLPAPDKRMKIYGQLFSDLSLLFPGEKIDLVFLEEARLDFQFKALTEGKPLYITDLENAFNYKEKIINLYRDYKYFIDEFCQGVLDTPIA